MEEKELLEKEREEKEIELKSPRPASVNWMKSFGKSLFSEKSVLTCIENVDIQKVKVVKAQNDKYTRYNLLLEDMQRCDVERIETIKMIVEKLSGIYQEVNVKESMVYQQMSSLVRSINVSIDYRLKMHNTLVDPILHGLD